MFLLGVTINSHLQYLRSHVLIRINYGSERVKYFLLVSCISKGHALMVQKPV